MLLVFVRFTSLLVDKERLVEHWLTNTLHTQVSVGRVHIRPSGIKIRHLCIHNHDTPFSKRFPYALEAESVELNFSLITILLAKKFVVSNLSVRGALFSVFPKSLHESKTNWMSFWQQYQLPPAPQLSYVAEKVDNLPIHIQSCVFIHPRVQGIKMNQKDFAVQEIPSIEFQGQKTTPPNFVHAVRSILYLSVEEGLLPLDLPASEVVKPLSEEAHAYFSSPKISSQTSPEISRPTDDIAGFVRELLFR